MLTKNCPCGSEGLMPVQPWRALNKNASLELLFPGLAPRLAVLHALELPLVLSREKK